MKESIAATCLPSMLPCEEQVCDIHRETVCSTLSAYFYFLKSCLDDVLDSPKLQSPELTHFSRQYLAIFKVVSWSCLREKTHGPYINLLCHDLHKGG